MWNPENFTKVLICIQVQCVRLGVLLEAKFSLLCFEMLTGSLFCNFFFFFLCFSSELNFCKTRSLLLKITDLPLCH